MAIDSSDDRALGFTETHRQGTSMTTPPINRILNFDDELEEGPMPTPEEQKAMILKWREETAAKSGNQKEKARLEAEARARAKKREEDLAKLEAIKRRRAELDAEEKALQGAVETGEQILVQTSQRREIRVHNDEDGSSDSESHPRRIRSKVTVRSDTDEEGDPRMKDRLSRMEKAMFGDRRISHEPVVSEEIEQYRPPSGGQFPKMNEFNGKGDSGDHCEKYESLMTGMGHCDIMLCKMFKTYLKGPATMWYRSIKPRSICSYDQLKRKFLRHYSDLCRREKDTEVFIHCRQRPNEELGDYLARFKEEDGFLSAGLDPIKGKKLRSSLYDIPPKSLNDIYLRGESIRRKMESIGGYRENRKEDRGRKGHDRYDSGKRYEDRRDEAKGRDKGAERRRDRDSIAFTPLNAPISKILHEIKGKPSFVRPARMKCPTIRKMATSTAIIIRTRAIILMSVTI
ncbi:hypothetical protein POM88_015207 [Heracleum sosnowskyi]|uniref:Retrotransposon gag domain-containing protein n=1 Tax=Heracleum sosnowskyi TaxID=360622 RepID=A0AAD8IL67_9APIA|nr:hypothetical protein POM88_015207 [Heracleum sosnowskyi]